MLQNWSHRAPAPSCQEAPDNRTLPWWEAVVGIPSSLPASRSTLSFGFFSATTSFDSWAKKHGSGLRLICQRSLHTPSSPLRPDPHTHASPKWMVIFCTKTRSWYLFLFVCIFVTTLLTACGMFEPTKKGKAIHRRRTSSASVVGPTWVVSNSRGMGE